MRNSYILTRIDYSRGDEMFFSSDFSEVCVVKTAISQDKVNGHCYTVFCGNVTLWGGLIAKMNEFRRHVDGVDAWKQKEELRSPKTSCNLGF